MKPIIGDVNRNSRNTWINLYPKPGSLLDDAVFDWSSMPGQEFPDFIRIGIRDEFLREIKR